MAMRRGSRDQSLDIETRNGSGACTTHARESRQCRTTEEQPHWRALRDGWADGLWQWLINYVSTEDWSHACIVRLKKELDRLDGTRPDMQADFGQF